VPARVACVTQPPRDSLNSLDYGKALTAKEKVRIGVEVEGFDLVLPVVQLLHNHYYINFQKLFFRNPSLSS
jgi:hypothetical protein